MMVNFNSAIQKKMLQKAGYIEGLFHRSFFRPTDFASALKQSSFLRFSEIFSQLFEMITFTKPCNRELNQLK